MEEKNIHIRFNRVAGKSELSTFDQELFNAAIDAKSKAYAPYSKFQVGCAIRLENGVIVQGNNQENIAYPSGLCAERVAMFAASAQYPGVSMMEMAVVVKIKETTDATVSPCGSCRQVMVEYERLQVPSMRILLGAEDGSIDIFDSVESLLPLAFFDSGLSKH